MAYVLKIKNKDGEWEGIPAIKGESAYDTAVRLGYFDGTEEEWAKLFCSIAQPNDDETSLQDLYNEGKVELYDGTTFDGNEFYMPFMSSEVRIHISGVVEFDFALTGDMMLVAVDGKAIDVVDGHAVFRGNVESIISIGGDARTATVVSFKCINGYKGGVITPELSEKLHVTNVYSSEEKKKLLSTEVFSSEDKANLKKLNDIKNAGYVIEDVSLIDLKNRGKIVAPNVTIGEKTLKYGTKATITVNGFVNISGTSTSAPTPFKVDGVQISQGKTLKYTGYANTIEIFNGGGLDVTFDTFEITTYTDGYMTGAKIKEIDEIKSEIGDIDTILDSIISKQEAYIGTDEASEGGEEV